MPHTLTKPKIYRMKVEGHYDPERPSWATTSTVFLWDHPQTKVGYLTRHFYSQSVSVGDTIPAWTYNTLQHYADISEEGSSSLYDTSNWDILSLDDSNALPPMSGPVPNTQGVYFAQRDLFDKTDVKSYFISDIDVLRFWPVGRPGTDGGLEAFTIGLPDEGPPVNETDWQIADARSIIEKGAAINDDSSPWTYLYKEAWLNDRKKYPKSFPSYIDYDPIYVDEQYLYPPKPELGTWSQGGRPIGIVSWSWTSYTAANLYAHFTDDWYQNRSSASAPGTFINPLSFTDGLAHASYGKGCINTEQITARQAGNSDVSPPSTNEAGILLTTETGIQWDPLFSDGAGGTDRVFVSKKGDPIGCTAEINLTSQLSRKMFLADQIWGGTYYEGGFDIENRGLAYHLASAVKWNSLGSMTQSFIGNLTDPFLYLGGYGRNGDGNYGPIPPLMNFNGGGEATWQNNPSWKNTAPYNQYSDWDTEYADLENYYSNTSEYLICSYVDYPENSWLNVYKPNGLIIPNGQETGMIVCPEYKLGDELLAVSKQDGTLNLVDLNSEARKLMDYRERGTLLPYHDYFPNPYIPFETSWLIPSGQHIPPYSFNCADYTYGGEVLYDNEGVAGPKGSKGDSAAGGGGVKGDQGDKGEASDVPGDDGIKGAKGNAGGGGMTGPTGPPGTTAGPQGAEGSSPTGPTGPTGPPGASPTGPPGSDGIDGIKGQPGEYGHVYPEDKGQKGNDIQTGSWGTVVGNPTNYTTTTAGYMDVELGDASTLSNETTTIRFSKKHFGVCVENSSDEPSYNGLYVYSSDFISD